MRFLQSSYIYGGELDNSKYLQKGENKNSDNENGGDIFNHYVKHTLHFKPAVEFYLFAYCFGLNHVTYEDAGEKSNHGHKHTVAYEIEEIKQLHTDNLYSAQSSVTQSGGNT